MGGTKLARNWRLLQINRDWISANWGWMDDVFALVIPVCEPVIRDW